MPQTVRAFMTVWNDMNCVALMWTFKYAYLKLNLAFSPSASIRSEHRIQKYIRRKMWSVVANSPGKSGRFPSFESQRLLACQQWIAAVTFTGLNACWIFKETSGFYMHIHRLQEEIDDSAIRVTRRNRNVIRPPAACFSCETPQFINADVHSLASRTIKWFFLTVGFHWGIHITLVLIEAILNFLPQRATIYVLVWRHGRKLRCWYLPLKLYMA